MVIFKTAHTVLLIYCCITNHVSTASNNKHYLLCMVHGNLSTLLSHCLWLKVSRLRSMCRLKIKMSQNLTEDGYIACTGALDKHKSLLAIGWRFHLPATLACLEAAYNRAACFCLSDLIIKHVERILQAKSHILFIT